MLWQGKNPILSMLVLNIKGFSALFLQKILKTPKRIETENVSFSHARVFIYYFQVKNNRLLINYTIENVF